MDIVFSLNWGWRNLRIGADCWRSNRRASRVLRGAHRPIFAGRRCRCCFGFGLRHPGCHAL